VLESYGKLWKWKMPFPRTWNVFEKIGFSKWLWGSVGFLFGEMDVA